MNKQELVEFNDLEPEFKEIILQTIFDSFWNDGVQQPFSNDTSLTSRSNKFNALNVDILISVHANAVGNPNVNGICSFYDGYSNVEDKINSLKLSQLIMNEIRKQGHAIYTGEMGDGKGSIPSYVGSWTDFHMNRMTTMPSVLLELGFMTGDKDFHNIFGANQERYTTQMAEAIAKGVVAYFGGKTENIKVPESDTHTVIHGDSLWAIGQKYGVSVNQLKSWNSLKSNMIFSGMKLVVKEPKKPTPEQPKPPVSQKVEEKEVGKVEDKGEKTEAVKLKENQVLTHDGRIIEYKFVK